MPASIFGDRFLGREPAWHRLGQVMDTTDLTATEAMKIADIAFPITKVPTLAEMPDGTLIETKQWAIVREPTTDDPEYRVLSTVGSEWTAIQTWELAQMLDPVTKEYPVETVGALGHGEKVFFTLNAGKGTIAGEEHDLYYLVTDHRDGLGALQIAFTPVRVVCQNTLTVGLNTAKVHVSLHHNKSIKADTQWYMNVFHDMLKARDSVISTMNQLSLVRVTDDEAKKILHSAYPDASVPRRLKLASDITPDDVGKEVWLQLLNDKAHYAGQYDKEKARVEVRRAAAWERYGVFNDSFPKVAGTPWAIWQAIVETEDYRRGKNDGSSDKAILYGNRAEAKARSFTTALNIATA